MRRFARRGWRMEVEWRDSVQLAHGEWFPSSEVQRRRKNDRCYSAGFVLADDKRGIVIASSIHCGEACGAIAIPRGAISKKRRLR